MIVIRNKIDKNLNSHFIKMDNNITLGHIYIIKLREFINNGEDVYKIGKTKKNNFNRFKNYPKGSRLLYYVKVNEYDKVEKIIIEIFKKKYKQRRDLGLEYFEEKFVEIETEINSIICNYTDDKMKYESKKDLLEYTNKEKKKEEKKVCSFTQTSFPQPTQRMRPKYSEENYENFDDLLHYHKEYFEEINKYFRIPKDKINKYKHLYLGSQKTRDVNHNLDMFLFKTRQELINLNVGPAVAFLQQFMIEVGAENKFHFKIGDSESLWEKVSEATKIKYELMFKPTKKMIETNHNPIIKMMSDLFGTSVVEEWDKKKNKHNSVSLFNEKKTTIKGKSVRIKESINHDFVNNHLKIFKYRFEKHFKDGEMNVNFGEEDKNFIESLQQTL